MPRENERPNAHVFRSGNESENISFENISFEDELIPARGAIAEVFTMEVTRELTSADLTLLTRLSSSEKTRTSVPALKKLRATHHHQAQLLAQGKTVKEIAAIVGCTPQRLVQLQVDPTFTELVKYYQDQVMTALMDDTIRLQRKLTDLGEMAVDELAERMEDDEARKRMRTGDVRQIAELALDRTVAPPKTTQNTQSPPAEITINFGTPIRHPEDRDVIRGPNDKIIEGTVDEGA